LKTKKERSKRRSQHADLILKLMSSLREYTVDEVQNVVDAHKIRKIMKEESKLSGKR